MNGKETPQSWGAGKQTAEMICDGGFILRVGLSRGVQRQNGRMSRLGPSAVAVAYTVWVQHGLVMIFAGMICHNVNDASERPYYVGA